MHININRRPQAIVADTVRHDDRLSVSAETRPAARMRSG
jgi:hypothetical protein